MDSETNVKLFLYQLKSDVKDNKTFVARRKDEKVKALLRELGWNRITLFEFLVGNLDVQDYISGPLPDYNGSEGDIWKFGKLIESKWVYIKIKLQPNGSKCMSFHEAEHELVFPLKGGSKK